MKSGCLVVSKLIWKENEKKKTINLPICTNVIEKEEKTSINVEKGMNSSSFEKKNTTQE